MVRFEPDASYDGVRYNIRAYPAPIDGKLSMPWWVPCLFKKTISDVPVNLYKYVLPQRETATASANKKVEIYCTGRQFYLFSKQR